MITPQEECKLALHSVFASRQRREGILEWAKKIREGGTLEGKKKAKRQIEIANNEYRSAVETYLSARARLTNEEQFQWPEVL